MGRKVAAVAAWDLEAAARAFARWRRSRCRGARIPEGLWEVAVVLAGEHGINPTAQSLRLNYCVDPPHPAAKVRKADEVVDGFPKPRESGGEKRGRGRCPSRKRIGPRSTAV